MKNRSPLLTIALALTGLLLVAVGLIALGSKETQSFPSANSFEPSGTSAFAELLRRSGYKVVIDELPTPKLAKGDLAIAFYSTDLKTSSFGLPDSDDATKPTKDALSKFAREGGNVISLPVLNDFQDESLRLYKKNKRIFRGDSVARVTWDLSQPDGAFLEGTHKKADELWADPPTNGAGTADENSAGTDNQAATSNDDSPSTSSDDEDSSSSDDGGPKPVDQATADNVFVMERHIGKGTDAVFSAGIIGTNRFIDQAQNAAVLMDVVGTLAAPGSRVVFTEGSFGNSREPALTEVIGPWAKAAWMQFVFLAIVIIYTLGKPFGLPNPERREERGSRELLDAMADTLRRGRMTKLALRTVYDEAQRQLRKKFRTPLDTTRPSAEPGSMAMLQSALLRVEAASQIGAPADQAAKMVGDVERLLKEVTSRTPTVS